MVGGPNLYNRSIVSVIIPAYNVGGLLATSVRSALSQTETDIEVVIVDDCSTDTTLEIAHAIADKDQRVRVLANDENVGPGESRNRAIDAARGQWVAVLDADDAWVPERLERLSPLLPEADVVTDDIVIEEAGKRTRRLLASHGVRTTEPFPLRPADLARHGLGLLKPVFRRTFVRDHGIRYDGSLPVGSDFCFFVDLALAGARWIQVPDAYYIYRRRADSVTGDRREHLQGRLASDSLLLARPGVQADAELRGLLEDRVGWLRDLDRLLEAHERGWPALARALVADPGLARTGARHGYHVLRRRVRAARGRRAGQPARRAGAS